MNKGPICEIVHGGHWTEAVKQISQMPGKEDEGYWYYQVLLPGKQIMSISLFIFSVLLTASVISSNQHTSFSAPI